MPEVVLLAPVPREHIKAARMKAIETGGRVAFGTGDGDAGAGAMWEFFATKVHPGMKVFIYVSLTGEGEYHGRKFSHVGMFEKVTTSESEVADLRPESTQTDTGYKCYWVVSSFHQLPAADYIPFPRLKVTPPLHGPTVKTIKQ